MMGQGYCQAAEIALELLDTIESGMVYTKKKLQEEDYGNAGMMLTDMMNGFFQIEKSLFPLFSGLSMNYTTEYQAQLRTEFDYIVSLYEKQEHGEVQDVFDERFAPVLGNWQKEIRRCIAQYMKECEADSNA